MFLENKVNINLNEKHFWNGIFGKETEYPDVLIHDFSETAVIIQQNNQIIDIELPIEEITRIELSY